jgi:hypothetical protein
MGKRKPWGRAERRAGSREHAALVQELEALARRQPGGSPMRPIDVESTAQVEPLASHAACPLCDGPMTLLEHTAETHDGLRLRVAHVRCAQCGVRRARYFQLRPTSLN